MAFNTCVVSGTITGLDGVGLADVTVEAILVTPFFHTDGTMFPPYRISTTTSASGTWSLTLAETATISKTIIIAFDLPSGTYERQRKEYYITVPNTASVAFNTLVTGQ